MTDAENCLVCITYQWCIWAIIMMAEEEETDHTIFNWEFCRMRIVLFTKLLKWFNKDVMNGSEEVKGDEGSQKR